MHIFYCFLSKAVFFRKITKYTSSAFFFANIFESWWGIIENAIERFSGFKVFWRVSESNLEQIPSEVLKHVICDEEKMAFLKLAFSLNFWILLIFCRRVIYLIMSFFLILTVLKDLMEVMRCHMRWIVTFKYFVKKFEFLWKKWLINIYFTSENHYSLKK